MLVVGLHTSKRFINMKFPWDTGGTLRIENIN